MNPLLWTIRLLLISPHKCDLSGFILSLTQTVGLPCFSNIRPTNAITRSMVKCSNFRRAWWNINFLDALASQKEAFCHGWCVVAHQSTSLVVWVLSGFTWPGRHWITINESIRKLCGNVQLCTHAHSSCPLYLWHRFCVAHLTHSSGPIHIPAWAALSLPL